MWFHTLYRIESMASMESHEDSFSEIVEVDLEFPPVEVSLLDRLKCPTASVSDIMPCLVQKTS